MLPGPGIRLEQVQRFSAYTPNVFSGFPGVAIDKVLHQHRNVFSSLPQRRNLKRKYIQAVEKILAECSGGYGSLQVAVSRNYNSHVCSNGSVSADALKFKTGQIQQKRY